MTSNTLIGLGFILTGVCLLLVAGTRPDSSDDLEQQRALYCEMVETFKNTGGEYGWPDYKGTYRRDCQ